EPAPGPRRMHVKASTLYRLVDPDASEGWVGLVQLVSIDADEPPQGKRAAIAMELTIGGRDRPFPPSKLIGLVLGANRVAEQAESALAALDKFASEAHAACDTTR